jgi:hypothetical protein
MLFKFSISMTANAIAEGSQFLCAVKGDSIISTFICKVSDSPTRAQLYSNWKSTYAVVQAISCSLAGQTLKGNESINYPKTFFG